ncbi:hypothetical protein ACMFMG_002476 [Clarireedia jacksonii]
MVGNLVHLPNGHNMTVNPVFGGFFFKANELNTHGSVFPAGWTVIIQTEDDYDEHPPSSDVDDEQTVPKAINRHIHPFKIPTLQNDSLFISSISNPSSSEFKPPTSPTRQIAMMLWATLYWYFHQPQPSLHKTTEASKNTPDAGKPKGEWRIKVRREGVLRGRNLLQKLERMGLITSEDSMVGLAVDENAAEEWSEMFASRRAFWQLSARLFLFSLTPVMPPGSPYGSRPSSPVHSGTRNHSPSRARDSADSTTLLQSPSLWSPSGLGPFSSGSHLPTYYPPHPLQYTTTSGVRHPLRCKPPRQGEIFYTRYIPSVGQYLSFRVASLSPKPVPYKGPSSVLSPFRHHATSSSLSSLSISLPLISDPNSISSGAEISGETTKMTDLQLLNRWMNHPRVDKFWGCAGPMSIQESFLMNNLESKHSFPAIGLWDGKPFGYFELYWVKEDILGRHLGDSAGEFDRGVHVLVGEDEFRGKHRVLCWITALAHWAMTQDYRTNSFVLEPRVDNERFISHLVDAGFVREREISFPHKQSAFLRLRRENFEAPVL